MQIPLQEFEQYIDETVLKGGLSCFMKGQVNAPEEITHGVYEAIVEGTKDYTVKLTIDNGIIKEQVCNCPYDIGPVCKHVAALIFYLMQDELGIKAKKSAEKKADKKETGKVIRKKTIAGQVDELLDKLTHEDIKRFISEQTAKDKEFRNLFLAYFGAVNAKESKELYAKQIKAALRAAAGRQRFIYRSKAGIVGKAANEMLVTAQKHLEAGNFRSTIFICTAALEELTAGMEYGDDSNGDFGMNITYAFELLNRLSKEQIPEEIRATLFNYTLSAFESEIYKGWDWHIGMLELAATLFKDKGEADRLNLLLDNIKGSEHVRESAKLIRLEVIRKTEGEKAAQKFIMQNLHSPEFRKQAIRSAINDKDFPKAIELAEDGIKQNSGKLQGLVMDWYDCLLSIALLQKDRDKIIEYARMLFIDHWNTDHDYYKVLKDNVLPKDWALFVEELVKDIKALTIWTARELLARIYVNEQWWDRLIAWLAETTNFQIIEKHEKHLIKDYSAELAQLYEDSIVEYLQQNVSRGNYKIACKYLRRMKKLGATDKVNKLIALFRKQYTHRRALLEELAKV